MVEYPPPAAAVEASRYYCATIFDNGNAGTVIGASIMRHREVIFRMGPSPNEGSVGRRLSRRGGKRGRADVDHSKRRAERGHGTITFVDADCDRMTAATSTLRGAYVFQVAADVFVLPPPSAAPLASRSRCSLAHRAARRILALATRRVHFRLRRDQHPLLHCQGAPISMEPVIL